MLRKLRFYLPVLPVHIMQRGNNCQAVFFDEQSYLNYLAWLRDGATKYGCRVHPYVLMTNHVHFLVMRCRGGIGKMIQMLGRDHVQYYNYGYKRMGTL